MPPAEQIYLLAAGEGLRMGQAKAWLAYRGRPLLERQLSFLLGIFPPRRIAVSVQERWLERCRSLHPEVAWTAVDAGARPLGAFQELLRRQALEAWGYLYHVDMPLWERGLFAALSEHTEEAAASQVEAVVPVCRGRRGHPVLLSERAAGSILELDPARDRLDFWLHGRSVREVAVDFPCALLNWNRREELESHA